MISILYYPPKHGQQYELFGYPAGETQVRLAKATLEAIQEAESVRVVATITANSQLMELALLVDAINRVAEFKKVQLVMPYLPYARADRRFVEGDCHGLNVFGKIVDSMLVDEVVTLDVHSPKAFQHVSRLRSLAPTAFIERSYAEVNRRHLMGPTILLPDEGSLARYKYNVLPSRFSVKHCSKIREASTGALSGFEVPEVTAKSVLIVDDICDGGGTFIGIAEKLPKNVKKYLYVTHGIFSKGIYPLLEHFGQVFTTNSFPSGQGLVSGRLTVYDALELL